MISVEVPHSLHFPRGPRVPSPNASLLANISSQTGDRHPFTFPRLAKKAPPILPAPFRNLRATLSSSGGQGPFAGSYQPVASLNQNTTSRSYFVIFLDPLLGGGSIKKGPAPPSPTSPRLCSLCAPSVTFVFPHLPPALPPFHRLWHVLTPPYDPCPVSNGTTARVPSPILPPPPSTICHINYAGSECIEIRHKSFWSVSPGISGFGFHGQF